MQILSTIKSIFRPKFTRQINWHFPPATYIFQHTHPHNIYRHRFYAIFFDILPPGRCFLKTIKCIQYSLLLIENYSQVIIYNLLQHLTQFDTISIVYCIHGYISPQNVSSCMKLSKYVEVCWSLSDFNCPHLFFLYSIYHLIKKVNKNFSTNSCKIRIIYYSTLHLKCQELFIASFDKLFAW